MFPLSIKIRSAGRLSMIFVLATATCLILEIFRPFMRVRLAALHTDVLGLMVSNSDMALERRRREVMPQGHWLDVVVIPVEACNQALRDQYAKAFRALPNVIVTDGRSFPGRVVHLLARAITHMGYRRSWFARHSAGSLRLEGLEGMGLSNTGRPFIGAPVIEDVVDLPDEIRSLLSNGRPLVCFANRDDAYWLRRTQDAPRRYRGTRSAGTMRNVDPVAYIPSLEFLISSGFNVIRMGRGSSKDLEIESEFYFDYASSSKHSDYLDLLLFSRCEFAFFGGSSGIASLAAAYKKPIVICDYRPFDRPFYSSSWSVVFPSKLVSSEGRLLHLRENLNAAADVTSLYERRGFQFLANSPDEVLACVRLGLMLLEGAVDPVVAQNHELQKNFWGLHRSSNRFQTIVPNGAGGYWKLKERLTEEAWMSPTSPTLVPLRLLEQNSNWMQ